ncbi:transcriptional regulator [Streptacidiphilus pinicola]|uniref:Transcriptional regulator n=1 Tax=Streptacidiphilus pinicola TaxID=2219663 RepID=A0A2X0JIJ9_9ACTN|nr:helix-turn-helix domain-containing protein [Streptacidiphilus pinicola]RAG87548.1 transcriptional regulator [Streptacidiphilus pinicola]
MSDEVDEDAVLDAFGVLGEPVRRGLYHVVAAAPGEVSRDAAAEVAGVSRALAAFHLDKLVEAGLLEVTFRRLSGRSGPGAGRPAKLYRRARREHTLSLPPRSYDTAGRLLAETLERAGLDRELQAVARERGAARTSDDPVGTLRAQGYAPSPDADDELIRLRNCPFHALAEEYPALVCGMNLALIEGLVGADGEWTAEMAPGPDRCCVALRRRPESA